MLEVRSYGSPFLVHMLNINNKNNTVYATYTLQPNNILTAYIGRQEGSVDVKCPWSNHR